MKIRHCEGSDVGRVRERNEDSLFAEPPLFAVADGMGGHEAGEIASSVAVHMLAAGAAPPPAQPETWLTELVRSANMAVYEAGNARGNLLRMGTTITAAYAADDALYLAHVGDSRAYLLHEGRLRQVTDDHSLVAEWVREGRLSVAEAAVHPQRSVITRALGMDPNVVVDVYRVVPAGGDRLLLCSDGLTGPVPDNVIEEILQGEPDPCGAVGRLIETANANGGEDNITTVVIDVIEGPPTAGASAFDDASAPATPSTQSHTAVQTLAPVGLVVNAPPPAPAQVPAPLRRRRRLVTRIVVGAVVLGAITGTAWFAVRTFVSNAYYVGQSGGFVAIFKGVPKNTFGVEMSTLVLRTPLPVASLPQNKQKDVAEGIRADNRKDADRTVAALTLAAQQATTTVPTTTTPAPTAPPTTLALQPPATVAPPPT